MVGGKGFPVNKLILFPVALSFYNCHRDREVVNEQINKR